MELTHITTLAGETVWINKDKIMTITTEEKLLGIAEEPRFVTVITLDDNWAYFTEEDVENLVWRLNQSEIEAAVDKLLAHDAEGRVVMPK